MNFASLSTPAGWFAMVLNIANLVLMLAAFFTSRPELDYVLLLLPWALVAIAAATRGRIRLIVPRGSPHPQLTTALGASGIGLLLVSFGGNQQPLEWMDLLYVSAVVTIGFTVAALIADPFSRQSFSSVFALLVISLLYGAGSAGMLNMRFDDSRGEQFAVQVLDKRSTTGRHSSYHLRLAPWGPRSTPEEVSVSSAFYYATAIGQTVCIDLHPGALQTPWINTHRCGR